MVPLAITRQLDEVVIMTRRDWNDRYSAADNGQVLYCQSRRAIDYLALSTPLLSKMAVTYWVALVNCVSDQLNISLLS